MKKQTIAFCAAFCALAILFSCNRDRWFDDAIGESSQDNAGAQSDFDDVFRMVDEETQKNEALRSPCAPTITTTFAQPDTFPATTVIDFGAACTGADGRTRSGQIVVTYTGRYRTPGTVINVVLQNYTVEGRQIQGTKTVTNLGPNGSGNLVYSVAVANGQITRPDGTVRTFSGIWNREWVEGQNTTFDTDGLSGILDDVWLITGSASGTRVNGNAYSATILTPLRREADCRYFVSGSVEIAPAGQSARVLDFGNGGCDDSATLSFNGQTRTITLP
jgi:hypothetical protein